MISSQRRGDIVTRSMVQTLAPPGILDVESSVWDLDPCEFDEFVEKHMDQMIVVEFCTDWCGPCKLMEAEINKFSKIYKDAVFSKVNLRFPGGEKLAAAHRIRTLPTVELYCGGCLVEQIKGFRVPQLRQALLDVSHRC